jgi:putative ATP-grasp target RiPP
MPEPKVSFKLKAAARRTGKGVLAVTDDIWWSADQFPLGRVAGLRETDGEGPGSRDTRPFGIRYAASPKAAGRDGLDIAELDYDFDRQIAVMRDGGSVLPAFKHTSGKTSTDTAVHDRNAGDKDTDVEQD